MYYKQLAVTGYDYTSDNMKFPEEAPSGIYEVGVVVAGNSMLNIQRILQKMYLMLNLTEGQEPLL